MPTEISGATGVNKVQSSAIETGDLPTGSVLQVVHGSYSTTIASTSASFVTAGTSATITPSSTSSKIYIIANQHVRIVKSDTDVGVGFAIKRGSTTVQSTATSYAFYTYHGANNYSEIRAYQPLQYLDSPNTTSATTYTIYFSVYSGTGQANEASNPSLITLMEIAG